MDRIPQVLSETASDFTRSAAALMTSPCATAAQWRSHPLPRSRFGGSGQLPVRRRPTATRRGSNGGGEARWSALAAALPDFGSRVFSASAVVAYVAVGAAAILSRSVTEAAREALAWVLPRNGQPPPRKNNEGIGSRHRR